jgi:hypothetical protein
MYWAKKELLKIKANAKQGLYFKVLSLIPLFIFHF